MSVSRVGYVRFVRRVGVIRGDVINTPLSGQNGDQLTWFEITSTPNGKSGYVSTQYIKPGQYSGGNTQYPPKNPSSSAAVVDAKIKDDDYRSADYYDSCTTLSNRLGSLPAGERIKVYNEKILGYDSKEWYKLADRSGYVLVGAVNVYVVPSSAFLITGTMKTQNLRPSNGADIKATVSFYSTTSMSTFKQYRVSLYTRLPQYGWEI